MGRQSSASLRTPWAVRVRYASPHNPPAKQLDSDNSTANLTTRRRTKPAALIESCTQGVGAPPPNSGRLRRKNVAGDSAPRPTLRLRPRPRCGSAPNPVQMGVGAGPPATFVRRSRPPLVAPLTFIRGQSHQAKHGVWWRASNFAAKRNKTLKDTSQNKMSQSQRVIISDIRQVFRNLFRQVRIAFQT